MALPADRKTRLSTLFSIIVVLFTASSTFAQQTKVFVGVGIFAIGDDRENRVQGTLSEPPRTLAANLAQRTVVEGGVFVANRFGFGAELRRLPVVRYDFRSRQDGYSDEQRENWLLGTVRIRVYQDRLGALDVVTGAGQVFEHRDTEFWYVSRVGDTRGSVLTETWTNDRRSLAYLLGLEVPILVRSHWALTPSMKWYFLRRGEPDRRRGRPYSFISYHSSQPFALGIGSRIVW